MEQQVRAQAHAQAKNKMEQHSNVTDMTDGGQRILTKTYYTHDNYNRPQRLVARFREVHAFDSPECAPPDWRLEGRPEPSEESLASPESEAGEAAGAEGAAGGGAVDDEPALDGAGAGGSGDEMEAAAQAMLMVARAPEGV